MWEPVTPIIEIIMLSKLGCSRTAAIAITLIAIPMLRIDIVIIAWIAYMVKEVK